MTTTIFKHHSKQYGGYGGCEDGYGFYSRGAETAGLGTSDLGYMAEDDHRDHDHDQSRSSSGGGSSTDDDPDLEIVINKHSRPVDQEDSRNNEEDEENDERWLRLGLGGSSTVDDARTSKTEEPTRRRRSPRDGLVELDLLPITSSTPHNNSTHNNNNNSSVRPLLLQPHGTTNTNSSSSSSFRSSLDGRQQQLSWGYMNPIPWNSSLLLSSASPLNHTNTTTTNNNNNNLYYSVQLPFQFQASGSGGPSTDYMRVIDAPSSHRQMSPGVWFVLHASSNQAREPFLPQIPKSYLRIKDGRMTVGLVMKYLVNKLKLNSESEIELTCRGLQLLPFFTLLHVRDSIWSASRDALTLLSDSTTDHLMILCYGRSAV